MIGKRPQAKACEAINGIVAEGEETIEEFGESPTIDTGLVAAGQAVEHYEMARYGALAGWADSAWHEGRRGPAQPEPARGNERGKASDANCEEQSGQNCVAEGGSVAKQLVISSPDRRELVRQSGGARAHKHSIGNVSISC